MTAFFSITAILTILVVIANRSMIYLAVGAVLCVPLLAHAAKSIALAIAPATVIPQWMIAFYAIGAVSLVALCDLLLAANRTPATLSGVRTQRQYAAQARQRVRRRVRFVTQETKPT